MKSIDFVQLPPEADIAEAAASYVHTDEYNRLYKEWRCREDNIYAFSGKRSQTCHTYVDGIGVQEMSPAGRERTALKNVCLIITVIVFIYAVADNVFGIPLIMLFKAFGIEISYSFHDSIAYGNQYAVLTYILFEGILKLCLPMILVSRAFRMPAKIAAPVTVRSHWHMAAAMPAACVGLAVLLALRLALPTDVLATDNIGMTYGVVSYMDGMCSAGYLVFEFVLVPLLMEILFHGALFQVLRQFGVLFAVIFTAIINTVIMHDPYSFTIIFLTSLISGLGVWQSGSIITGMLVHSEMRVLSFLFFQCEEMPDLAGIPAQWICIILMIVVGSLWMLALSVTGKGKLRLVDYSTFLCGKEKVKICFTGSAMLASWVLCLLLMVIEIAL